MPSSSLAILLASARNLLPVVALVMEACKPIRPSTPKANINMPTSTSIKAKPRRLRREPGEEGPGFIIQSSAFARIVAVDIGVAHAHGAPGIDLHTQIARARAAVADVDARELRARRQDLPQAVKGPAAGRGPVGIHALHHHIAAALGRGPAVHQPGIVGRGWRGTAFAGRIRAADDPGWAVLGRITGAAERLVAVGDQPEADQGVAAQGLHARALDTGT